MTRTKRASPSLALSLLVGGKCSPRKPRYRPLSRLRHTSRRTRGIAMTGLALFVCIAAPGKAAQPPRSAADIRPLSVGDAIPDVTLLTAGGDEWSLRAEASRGPLVLIFYRGGWCPYCTRHLAGLRDVEANLRALGFRIVAASPDRPATLAEGMGEEDLPYLLVSDSRMQAARAFGIAFRVDDATVGRYRGFGIDLEEASGEDHHLLPVPAVFILGSDGRVRFAHAHPDYTDRLSPAALLTAAKRATDPPKTHDRDARE